MPEAKKTRKRPRTLSGGEETLALHLRLEGIPFEREYQFHLTRKWRFDFMLMNNVVVEIDGGNWMVRNGKAVGRHTKDSDYDKRNAAVIMGFRVLYFTPAMLKSGKAIATIKEALK